MTTLENLSWRYATKKFDPSKKVSAEDLASLREAISLSATSYGLELYKVIIVEDAETRAKLLPASWGQTQITDASQVFVFANRTDVKPEEIDAYINRKAEAQGIDPENLKGYSDFMKQSITSRPQEDQAIWTSKQVYIALANLMNAAAELKIDTCPMEGFDPTQYNEILGLNEQGLNAAVVATVGYRSDEDATQNMPKVRKPQEELFELV